MRHFIHMMVLCLLAPTVQADIAPSNYMVLITQPLTETYPDRGSQWLMLTASVSPELEEEHYLRLWHNGNMQADRQKSVNFKIEWLPRGTHEFKVVVVDKQNTVIKESPVTRVYQQRTIMKRHSF